MSEIRNCEEYVVSRLIDLESENDKLASCLEEKSEQVRQLESTLIYLFNKCLHKEKSAGSGEHYFDTTYRCWQNSESDEYDFLDELYGTYHKGVENEQTE